MSLSSYNGGIGQKTFMILLLSLLPLIFSCAASSDLVYRGRVKSARGKTWRSRGIEGVDHQHYVRHILKTKEERMTYVKNLMAAKAKDVKAEKAIHTPPDGKTGNMGTEENYRLSLHSKITINAGEFNNITLPAVAWVPTPHPENPNEKFPVVIFPNSWGWFDYEYILASAVLAQKGYVTVGYQTRGWYNSGGMIDVAGDKDRADASKVIDFLLSDERANEWNINKSSVAFAGISYGAGISQMMAGYDRRVKTVVSMSGWGDIMKALYGYESVNHGTTDFLIFSGELLGRIPPNLINMMHYLENHTHIEKLESFAQERSPSSFINAINTRNRNGYKVSVFMSLNMGDDFFPPQHTIAFWQQLEVPKMLIINQGDHAEAEVSGLFGQDNYIWDKVSMWLDHELKGINNGILTDPVKEPQVRVQAGDSVFSSDYIPFPQGWPQTTANSLCNVRSRKCDNVAVGPTGTITVDYKLSGRGGASGSQYGGLDLMSNPRNSNPSTSLNNRKRYNDDDSLNTISYTPEPGINGGIFIISGMLNGLGFPTSAKLNKVPTATAILYATTPFKKAFQNTIGYKDAQGIGAIKRDLFVQPKRREKKNVMSFGEDLTSTTEDRMITICGNPEIKNFTFTPYAVWPGDKKKSFSDRWQLYAFLYDQDTSEEGRLISDGAFTRYQDSNRHDGNDNVYIWQRPDGTMAVTIKSFVMRTVCRRIPAGNKLVLGFTLAYPGHYLPSFPGSGERRKSLDNTRKIGIDSSLYEDSSYLEVEVHYDNGSVLALPFV